VSNLRNCRQCGKMVDFDEPWCDHETMEESAWIDIFQRGIAFGKDADAIDRIVEQAAAEMGVAAAKFMTDGLKEDLDK
jgi:hypothetical protein